MSPIFKYITKPKNQRRINLRLTNHLKTLIHLLTNNHPRERPKKSGLSKKTIFYMNLMPSTVPSGTNCPKSSISNLKLTKGMTIS